MDDDDLRRGRSACHRAFDEATAILAGDSLLTLAFEVLAREIKPEAIAIDCVKILAEASGAIGMAGGQMADLEAGGWNKKESHESRCNRIASGTLFTLEAIHRRKTGALLRAPLRMGAVIVGASDICIDVLDRYGAPLDWLFRSSTIYSTYKGRSRNWASGSARIPIWANGHTPSSWASTIAVVRLASWLKKLVQRLNRLAHLVTT